MTVEFGRSDRCTLGIEWELPCIDTATRELAPVGGRIVEALATDGFPEATVELLTNTVELVSGPHARVADAVADLTGLLDRARAVATTHGADLMSAGTHPFSRSADQQLTPGKERYASFLDGMRLYGEQMLIWGLHVHVGMPDHDAAVLVTDTMPVFLPHLLALSASSPYFEGADTGYASTRTMIFQQANTAGLPPVLKDWATYERITSELIAADVVEDVSELRWDVRPSPHWGTVETRFSDAPVTVGELSTLAALTQCMVESVLDAHEQGEPVAQLPPWYVRENKWRAARYGLDAEIIVDGTGRRRALRDDVPELVERLAPVAERLGCADELAGVHAILEHGTGAERMRTVAAEAGDDLTAVVDALVFELHEHR
jgi:glutamate---cysteine ligase / carboxylate-amine ligase